MAFHCLSDETWDFVGTTCGTICSRLHFVHTLSVDAVIKAGEAIHIASAAFVHTVGRTPESCQNETEVANLEKLSHFDDAIDFCFRAGGLAGVIDTKEHLESAFHIFQATATFPGLRAVESTGQDLLRFWPRFAAFLEKDPHNIFAQEIEIRPVFHEPADVVLAGNSTSTREEVEAMIRAFPLGQATLPQDLEGAEPDHSETRITNTRGGGGDDDF